MKTLLRVRNLRVEFGFHGTRIPAVRGISFDIRPGSTVALVGESGSGKSVTAQAILGILPNIAHLSHGRILLADPAAADRAVDIAALDPDGPAMRAIRAARVSMIFQEPMVSLSPLHTIGDQVSEALFLHRDLSRREGLRLTEEMLDMVGFPNPHGALRAYPFELSGGLRQRAMIAMALVCHPALLIADEPTTALDVTIQAQILDLIRRLQRELGMAVLLITHDLGVVANMAEEVLVMYHGEILERGSIDDLFRDPRHPYLKALLRAVPHFDMQPDERLTPVRKIPHDPASAAARAESAEGAGEPQLVVEGISRSFTVYRGGWLRAAPAQTTRAVNDVSFTVRRSECFGLVGESGCGKSTLGKIIMRALGPDAGVIRYNDRGRWCNMLALDEAELFRLRPRIQLIFQDPFSSLNPRMTVFDILREPLVIHRAGGAAAQRSRVMELMRLVGLDPRYLNRYPHSFSGGQRQRIGIARALALDPDMIICDEPVSALDVSIQAQVLNLLKDLQAELGLTYLFISHNLAVVDYMADRIAVMCAGRLVEIAPRAALFNTPLHPYTQSLLKAVPFADLDHLLDLSALADSRGSDPAAWPAPFTVGDDSCLVEYAPDHWVRLSHRDARAGQAA